MNLAEKLEAAKARADAATDGPWQTRFLYRTFNAVRKNASALGLLLDGDDNDWRDCEWIAAARSEHPKMLECLTTINDVMASGCFKGSFEKLSEVQAALRVLDGKL